MLIISSMLHFQYARLNVVITFESSFSTATLLVFGCIPAVWVSVTGIVFGSIKRVVERRFFLHKDIPLTYDLGIIIFNSGMVGSMWVIASWIYISLLKGELPLTRLNVGNTLSIIIMFISLSVVNHIVLFISSYLQGHDPMTMFKKGLVPAFLTEFATIPFGVLMALAYTRMGPLAFFFLGSTLLLSNAVLRNLSIIRYDQEEKLRQLTALNAISREIISLRNEDSVFELLFSDINKITETGSLFLAKSKSDGRLELFSKDIQVNSPLYKMAERVLTSRKTILVSSTKREAPEDLKSELLAEEIRSFLILPLKTGDKIYGIMGVFSKEVFAFKHEHLQVLGMVADEAALAMENSILYTTLTDKLFELEHLNKELRHLDKLKSEFLANVSHELRTPLTSIKGYVEYIRKEKMGPITPMMNEGLTVAQRNILRLQRLIDDLLDYTRLEFKRQPLTLATFSFDQLWHEVYDAYAESISAKKLVVHVNIPPDLPVFLADFQKILQVLNNLISNAIKFTPDGGNIYIEAQLLEQHPRFYNPDTYRSTGVTDSLLPISLSVQDDGVGIPDEAIPKIFERFYQVDSSNTRKYGGTGLGLAIVKSILNAHGIPVTVRSALGVGTTFILVIPGIQPTDIQGSTIRTISLEDQQKMPKYVV